MSFTEYGRPTLDPDALSELRACDDGGDGSLLAELIDIYLQDTPRRLLLLRQACEAADLATLAHESHALKGSCSQFGALRLAESCRRIEQLARAGSLDGVDELIDGIDREYPRVTAALAAERGR